MTCIAGYAREGEVWLGGDSAGVAGFSLTIRADPKVFVRRQGGVGWIFGYTSSFRLGQVLAHHLELPNLLSSTRSADARYRFMVREFIPALRTALRDAGWLAKKDEREEGGSFLVGVAGGLYAVDSDFQVGRSRCAYDAVGVGADAAMGALVALDQVGGAALHPRKRLTTALKAAEAVNIGVRGPFTVRVSKAPS